MRKLLCLFVLALVALSIALCETKERVELAAPTTGTVINLWPLQRQ